MPDNKSDSKREIACNATLKQTAHYRLHTLENSLKDWLLTIDRSIDKEDEFIIVRFEHVYNLLFSNINSIRNLLRDIDNLENEYIHYKLGD